MALVSIRNYACHQKDCLDVHDTFNNLGAEGFLKHVLGDLSQFFVYKGVEKDVGLSFSLSINLPYLFNEAFVKEKPKKEKAVKEEPLPWENIAAQPFDLQAAIARPARAARGRNVPVMVIHDEAPPVEVNHDF
jgi:hypothetical protein